MKRLERMPVPLLPALVGALTLSNVYYGMGFEAVRHITMGTAAIVLLLYLIKIVCWPGTVMREYQNTVTGSLYGAFPMIMMILGSYYHDYLPGFGKVLWLVAIGIHGCHILVFTYKNVIRKREVDTFLPSWFVTYNGIMVSCVVGGGMEEKGILQFIMFYGIIIYLILIPIMILRLLRVKIKETAYHTQAIVLAPCSFCLVSYINVIGEPNMGLALFLYGCVLLSLLFVITKLPYFFSYSFVPGFAGLTFPMAIAIVAGQKMSGYLNTMGNEKLAYAVKQLSGLQIYLTTMIIGYVLLNFLIMAMKIERK